MKTCLFDFVELHFTALFQPGERFYATKGSQQALELSICQ